MINMTRKIPRPHNTVRGEITRCTTLLPRKLSSALGAPVTGRDRPALFRRETPGPVQRSASAGSHQPPALFRGTCSVFFPSQSFAKIKDIVPALPGFVNPGIPLSGGKNVDEAAASAYNKEKYPALSPFEAPQKERYMKQIILTGDRPTGRLHVGHYVGSLKERVALQNSGKFDEIYIMIADAQALTDNAEHPEKVRQNIMNVALDYLACGLDPEKSTLFIQSMIPELTELTFYYMNLVTVSRVQRNPTVKAEIQMRNFEASIPVGFFCYPISQAADITAFRATAVPVGEDQLPMLEQCKEIVHKFNAVYGDTLVDPQIILPKNQACLRLPGIDGKAKMSKSLGNCIYLSDSPEDIRTKVMSMFTDPTHLRREDPGHTEGNPVFIYLDAFCRPEYFPEFLPEYSGLDELKAHYQRGGLGDVKIKKFLNAVMQAELEPIRNRRKEWEQRLPEVVEILKEGSAVAEKTAAATLANVRKAMRIDYFADNNLLK